MIPISRSSSQAWVILHRPGDPRGTEEWSTHTDTEMSRPGRVARGLYGVAATLREHYHYNGSGPQAFGGAKRWPALTLVVAFPENAEELRDLLGDRLRSAVDVFLQEHNLEAE